MVPALGVVSMGIGPMHAQLSRGDLQPCQGRWEGKPVSMPVPSTPTSGDG